MKSTSLFPRILLCGLAVVAVGCAAEEPAPEPDPEPEAAAPSPAMDARLEGDFSTPESVLHDPGQDVYFVSNIAGSPVEADGNGYISRVDAVSREVQARWIDGAAEGVTLDAPKGMAIVGDTLWVTDITVVRSFDRSTGAATGEVAVEGATFLNDLAPGPDGSLYVSDSGLTMTEEGPQPTGTDAIYRISADGAVERLASGDELLRPNGLALIGEQLWAVSYGGNRLYRVAEGGPMDVVELPGGGLDGLVRLPDGDVLVSSWGTSAVYRGPVGGPFTVAVADVAAPADIGFDAGRGVVLVPLFNDDAVVIRALE